MMGTRCGSIDPAIIPYLMRKGELTTADEIDKMMNKKSGMLGVSGISSDIAAKNRTVILTTHRPAVLKRCTRVYALEKGCARELTKEEVKYFAQRAVNE